MRRMLAGLRVSGSTAANVPVLTLKTSPGDITYFMLATGRGRRNTDTVGLTPFKPYVSSRLTPVGSPTTSMVNSGLTGWPLSSRGGHGKPTRKSPRLSSSECEDSGACGNLGLFEPSTAAKTGSSPLVRRQRSRNASTETLIALAG